MTVKVRLPFWSGTSNTPITVTQQQGEGDHVSYLYNSWDFALEAGWRVRSIANGTVVDIRETVPDGDASQLTADTSWGSGGIGNIVTIRSVVHGQVFYASYFHLMQNSVPVTIGTVVTKGQVIGEVGETGARSGTHLHLQVGTTSMAYGATANGWPTNTDNGSPQTIANASHNTANDNLISFAGYGTHLPHTVIGPPANTGSSLAPAAVPNFTEGADTVTLSGGGTFHTKGGNDVISAGAGTYVVFGDGGNDLITLNNGKDQLHGGIGDDSLAGNGGNDKLFGDDGADWLFGGAGNDKMTGGTGADFFVFDSGYGKDKIVDFEDNVDHLALYRESWGGTNYTAAEVESHFGHASAAGYVLDFGNGSSLTFLGISNGTQLLDQIFVVHH